VENLITQTKEQKGEEIDFCGTVHWPMFYPVLYVMKNAVAFQQSNIFSLKTTFKLWKTVSVAFRKNL